MTAQSECRKNKVMFNANAEKSIIHVVQKAKYNFSSWFL